MRPRTIDGTVPAAEMTADPRFAARVRRLVLVSSVALGIVFGLALAGPGRIVTAVVLIGGGWITMPTILAASLARPGRRYGLTLPSALVAAGVALAATGYEGTFAGRAGWWLITAGIWLGGLMGMWFWFRWMPVPRIFDDPFSTSRWSLIAIHVGLVVVGSILVLSDRLL